MQYSSVSAAPTWTVTGQSATSTRLQFFNTPSSTTTAESLSHTEDSPQVTWYAEPNDSTSDGTKWVLGELNKPNSYPIQVFKTPWTTKRGPAAIFQPPEDN